MKQSCCWKLGVVAVLIALTEMRPNAITRNKRRHWGSPNSLSYGSGVQRSVASKPIEPWARGVLHGLPSEECRQNLDQRFQLYASTTGKTYSKPKKMTHPLAGHVLDVFQVSRAVFWDPFGYGPKSRTPSEHPNPH